jgi:hypothetical protein
MTAGGGNLRTWHCVLRTDVSAGASLVAYFSTKFLEAQDVELSPVEKLRNGLCTLSELTLWQVRLFLACRLVLKTSGHSTTSEDCAALFGAALVL